MEWSEEFVWAYVEGELNAEERAFVEAELKRDPARSVEMEEMQATAKWLRRETRGGPPKDVSLEMPEPLAAIFSVSPLRAEPKVWHRPAFVRAAASDERGAWFLARLKEGSAEIDVRVDRDARGAPVLWISWNATFLPFEGWTLALKPDSDLVARTFQLPPLKAGEWTANEMQLGFDPQDVPFEIAWDVRQN